MLILPPRAEVVTQSVQIEHFSALSQKLRSPNGAIFLDFVYIIDDSRSNVKTWKELGVYVLVLSPRAKVVTQNVQFEHISCLTAYTLNI